MDELDFSQPVPKKPAEPAAAPAPAKPAAPAAAPAPAVPSIYNAAMAMDFFRAAGKPESFAAGAAIFAEDEKSGGLFGKRAKMYLLLTGEVEMRAQGKPIGGVRVGEVFGEMAVIAQAARTATAVAKSASTVIGMDEKQFQAGLNDKPEFALMVMSLVNVRLRSTISRLHASRTLHAGEAKESVVFDKKTLASLVQALGQQSVVRCEAGKMLMQEGAPGNVMYVVLEGRMTMSIKAGMVGRAGPGGVFGEMALVDQSPRAATAAAETDCSLLAINRAAFLHLVKNSPTFGSLLLAGLAARATAMAERNK